MGVIRQPVQVKKLSSLLRGHNFSKSEHGYVEKTDTRKRCNAAFNSTSVAEALNGKLDRTTQQVYRKGAYLSRKAISEANESGKSAELRKSVKSLGTSKVSNEVDQEKKYLQDVKRETTAKQGDIPSLLCLK